MLGIGECSDFVFISNIIGGHANAMNGNMKLPSPFLASAIVNASAKTERVAYEATEMKRVFQWTIMFMCV